MLYHLLYPIHETLSVFRVFKYISFRTSSAVLTAIFICFILGPTFIRLLTNRQMGQVVRDDGPQSHLKKKGTPTMGGILILASVVISTLLWSRLDSPFLWVVLFVLVGMGGIGFMDDYIKLRRNPKGLTSLQKVSMQLVVSLIAVGMLFTDFASSTLALSHFDTTVTLPFFKGATPNLSWFFVVWVIFILVGSSNAVNLTDGLDGLAIGPIITASITFLILAYISGHSVLSEYLNVAYTAQTGELAIFCGALFGASLGFLWFNTYPAQVFMGDVGSLGIGGALGMLAVVVKQEILWALVGGIFVLETLSVIVQVASFKATGRRVFRMAPIHHHFELKGWAEPKVIVRFWIISIILSLLALSSLKLR